MAQEFCVVCGRTDVPVVDGVCADCFARQHPLVEVRSPAMVVICPTCGARRVGQRWERHGASQFLSAEDLNPFLIAHHEVGIRRVHWEETGQNPLLRQLVGEATVRFRGTERQVALAVEVRIQHHTCPECSRRSGHYYTAIIQLRGEEGGTEKSLPLRTRLAAAWDGLMPEAREEWKRGLAWREELPEGHDLYFSDSLAARAMARLAKARWGAELKESASLWGRKSGREVYRVTFCLRVPEGAPSAPARRPKAPARREPQRIER